MVATTFDADQNQQFIIRPNRSLSWAEIRVFYLAVVVISGAIATSFTMIGFWPVIPFTGLELLALGAALYVCARRCYWREVVSVRSNTIEVEKGRYGPEESWSFPRAWAQVELSLPVHRRHPSTLRIRSHGRQVELGTFLTEWERRALANDLQRAIRANHI
jgi:uncharacterized membrane protein